MASVDQLISKPFSRMMNGLAELQPMWPAFVKNDGVGGLTVDPTLYASSFGPDTKADEGGLNSENDTPGVRVEAIKDDGTAAASDNGSNTTFKVTLSGAGTFNPRCVVHQAGVETKFMLIAPSNDTRTNARTEYPQDSATTNRGWGGALESTGNAGPYPVFMTVQEFAEMLDTYRHIGTNDDEKVAFAPHGIEGGGRHSTSSASANPAVASDPRISSNTNWPAEGSATISETLVRATVFMPMMLDNNQLDKRSTNATVDFSTTWWTSQWARSAAADARGYLTKDGEGLARYDTQPDGVDSSVIRYKNLGYSGDHLTGKVGAWSFLSADNVEANARDARGYANADLSLDSTPSLGPKYRMRMALACFLKNGEYDITDGGNLIPYVYDADRTIGGKNTMTLYQVWNGLDGYDDCSATDFSKDCDAQIYPMFDFVQGPVCPAAQGTNGEFDAIVGAHRGWPNTYEGCTGDTSGYAMGSQPSPRMWEVRPNPRRHQVFGVEISDAGRIKFYVRVASNDKEDTFRWKVGMPIYLTGMTGKLGTDTENPDFYPDTFMASLADGPTRNQTAFSSTKGMNLNGWWQAFNTSPTGNPTSSTYDALFSDGDTTAVKYYTVEVQTVNKFYPASSIAKYRIGSPTGHTSTAYIQQGRMAGHAGGGTNFYYYAQTSLASTFAKYYGSISSPARDGNVTIPGVPSWMVGAMTSDSNVPVNNNDTFPGRPTVFKAQQANQSGTYASDATLTARSIQLNKAGDGTYSVSPASPTKGGGTLRIPPPVGWDMALSYMCRIGTMPMTSSGSPNNEFGENIYSSDANRSWIADGGWNPRYQTIPTSSSFAAQPYSRWIHRGISIPFWSYMDHATGKHAFDHIKPVSASGTWLYGRNRPWPAHERLGTRVGYGPSLLASAKQVAANGKSYDGWDNYTKGTQTVDAGEETTKIGLTEMGCSPVWLDCEIRGWFPTQQDRMTLIEFDNNQYYPLTGRHSMITGYHGNSGNLGFGFHPISKDGSTQYPNTAVSGTYLFGKYSESEISASFDWIEERRPTFSVNRPAVYVWGTSPFFEKGYPTNSLTTWVNSEPWPYGNGNVGYGSLGNQIGTGTTYNITEGTNTIRNIFTEAGQTFILNGSNKGTDPNGASPVWGMTIKACDAAVAKGASSYASTLKNSADLQFPGEDGPNARLSTKDFQLDYLHLRQIPSPAMVPFNVDSLTQKVTNIAKYRNLTIEAENISATKGMEIKVSILTAPTPVSGRPQGPGGAVVEGFEEVDPLFVAGVGVVDLENLPAAQVTNGFVVRYHFYIPDATQTSLHPIDWKAIPIIRKWTLNYDLKPTASLSVIGNSFSGDLSSPIGTEVGHIISFRGTGTTADPDRLISEIKFDFGDGTNTGWLSFSDQTLQSTTYDTAHVYSKAGTFSATVTTKDNNGNESSASAAISVVVAEVKPVALLRAIPQMVRAGQAITFDASESYTLSSDTDRTIASYSFNFGDGSSAVSGAASSATHTYAAAGEYMATVTATDNATSANTSQAAKVVVKILPATLVVPLTLNTQPASFSRTRRASFATNEVLDAVYPEMSDTGQRSDEFKLTGSFLKETANADIDFMEELLVSGALVEFEWEDVNFSGTPTGKTFVGRLLSFDYNREGGRHGETPYTATLVREAGLGN